MSTHSISFPDLKRSPDSAHALILGTAAAVLAVLIGIAHWTFALFGGFLVLILAAMEFEPFLLTVIFLIPVGWLAKIHFPLGGSDARVDFATGVRILVVVGFFAGRIWRGQINFKELISPKLMRLSLLFGAVAIASVLLAPSGILYGSFKAVIRLFSYFGFFGFVMVWADSEERIKTIVHTLMWSTIVVCTFGIFQELIGDYTSFWLYLNPPEDWFLPMEHRPPSFLNYSNSLAGYVNLMIPLALACYAYGEKKWKSLGGFVAAIGFVTLLCTQSLGGLAAFAAVILLAILMLVRKWKTKVLLLSGIFASGAVFYVSYEVLNPAHGGDSFGYDQVTRLLLWGVAWNLFLHSPILGVGWGNFVELYGPYLKDFSWIPDGIFATHNTYLQFLSETGLIGFGAFFWLLLEAIRQGLRQFSRPANCLEKALAFGVIGAILTICVHGMVDFLFHVSPQFGTLFWTLLALLVACNRTFRDTSCGRHVAGPGFN